MFHKILGKSYIQWPAFSWCKVIYVLMLVIFNRPYLFSIHSHFPRRLHLREIAILLQSYFLYMSMAHVKYYYYAHILKCLKDNQTIALPYLHQAITLSISLYIRSQTYTHYYNPVYTTGTVCLIKLHHFVGSFQIVRSTLGCRFHHIVGGKSGQSSGGRQSCAKTGIIQLTLDHGVALASLINKS